jgi:hypothetical protein
MVIHVTLSQISMVKLSICILLMLATTFESHALNVIISWIPTCMFHIYWNLTLSWTLLFLNVLYKSLNHSALQTCRGPCEKPQAQSITMTNWFFYSISQVLPFLIISTNNNKATKCVQLDHCNSFLSFLPHFSFAYLKTIYHMVARVIS